MSRLIAFITLLVLSASSLPAQAQWGTIKGRFVFDGAPPAAKAISVTKDAAFCGKHDLKDESLVVNEENKGIANVVLTLYLARGDKAPTPHPDYAKTATDEVHLDNQNCRFEPHVVLVRTSQTLVVGNKDAVGHNTKIDTLSNTPINPIIPANGELKHKFTDEERIPSLVSCSIHPWMNARVVVKESPYMAVTDADGNFEIKNLPVGDWTFLAWHEASGYVQEVKLGGKATKWARGRFEQSVKEGDNDMGDILIAPAAFKN